MHPKPATTTFWPAMAFFAFIGFDEVITLAEETKNPTRTVPLASLGISTRLYVAVAVVPVGAAFVAVGNLEVVAP